MKLIAYRTYFSEYCRVKLKRIGLMMNKATFISKRIFKQWFTKPKKYPEVIINQKPKNSMVTEKD